MGNINAAIPPCGSGCQYLISKNKTIPINSDTYTAIATPALFWCFNPKMIVVMNGAHNQIENIENARLEVGFKL